MLVENENDRDLIATIVARDVVVIIINEIVVQSFHDKTTCYQDGKKSICIQDSQTIKVKRNFSDRSQFPATIVR